LQNLKRRAHLEVAGVDGMIILKWMLERKGRTVCTGFMWLRMGTNGEIL
jgi:hypothetical protein